MNTGKYVFAQVTSLLPLNDFNKCAAKYKGHHKIKHFTFWNQLMCMLFGQLSNRDSLSDLNVCLNTQRNNWYHLGMGTGISKSNLAYANENRDWRIFADYTNVLIDYAQKICRPNKDFSVIVEGNVYAVDSTTIELCMTVFCWAATFTKHKASIKMHTQLDVKKNIPSFIHVSNWSVHDVGILDMLKFEEGSFYILDRGYFDFVRLYSIHTSKAFFVTRLKGRTNYSRVYSAKTDRSSGVMCDQTIKFNHFYAKRKYPEQLRTVKYYDKESEVRFDFITNNFDVSALEIAQLYKYRWSIELFFKWIKQHLKMQRFWGHSENAVRTQLYIAITAYLNVAIFKEVHKIKHSNYEILQILSLTLLNKTPVNQLFQQHQVNENDKENLNQLILF